MVSDVDRKQLGAKRAIDLNKAVFIAHFGPFLFRETGKYAAVMLWGAAAPARQGGTLCHPHFAFLVKQPPDQAFQRQLDINQLVGAGAARQSRDMLPLRMLHLGMQPRPP